jgi:fumarylpyruvate hydrolase
VPEKGDFVFAPPDRPSVAIRGESARYPVRRIFCVGRNYAAHAREMGKDPDREPPFYFTKQADGIVASGATVPYPPMTGNYHYEMELVVALGAAFRVTEEAALECVYGYACGLDMTRRDLQQQAKEAGRPWDTSKAFDQSAIIGDITRVADCGHLSEGAITLEVNGELKQSGDLSEMIWDVPETIANLSQFYHLKPGDLIYTGTPAGVGPLKPGDTLTGRIEGLGDIALAIGPPE